MRCLLPLLLSLPCFAQDAGVTDAPKVVILPGDNYLFNKPAFDTVNSEMSRLQGVERQHKAEQWATPVIIGLVVGVVAGAAVAVPVTLYLSKPGS